MEKLLKLAALSFFVFIIYIIYLANTGQSSIFFNLVASMPYGDKIGHLAIFATLTFGANMLLNFRNVPFVNSKLPIYFGSVLVLLFAAVEELSQNFVASRTLDISDFIADIVGIAIATWLSYLFAERKRVISP